jgi:hypothetical protein
MPHRLIEGLRRYQKEQLPHLRERFAKLASEGQKPATLFIGCSDSRLLPNLLTDSGPGEIFILPRGTAGRLPWIHQFDGRLGVNFRLAKDSVLQLSMDVFNLFNFQQTTGVDENYTYTGVFPIENGVPSQLPQDVPLEQAPGNLTLADVNANFRQPVRYQPVRSFRFGPDNARAGSCSRR